MPRVRTTLTPEEGWDKAQNTLAPGETQADRTRFLLGLRKLGQHCTFTEDGQPAAILPHVPNFPAGSPEQTALESEWESKAIEMHDNQRTITLPDKPSENRMERRPGTLIRGD